MVSEVYVITSDFKANLETNPLRARAATGESIEAKVVIINDTGGFINMYWVHPLSRELELLNEYPEGKGDHADGRFKWEAYVNQEFVVEQAGVCMVEEEAPCRQVNFTVSGINPSKCSIPTACINHNQPLTIVN